MPSPKCLPPSRSVTFCLVRLGGADAGGVETWGKRLMAEEVAQTRQRAQSSVAYNLFEMDKDRELGSLNGSDDELSASYEPDEIGSDLDN